MINTWTGIEGIERAPLDRDDSVSAAQTGALRRTFGRDHNYVEPFGIAGKRPERNAYCALWKNLDVVNPDANISSR
jgi:hypothetical protein